MKPFSILPHSAKLAVQLTNLIRPNTFIKSFNLIEVYHIDDDALCLVRAQGTQQLSSDLASKLSIYPYGSEAFLLGAAGAEGYHHV